MGKLFIIFGKLNMKLLYKKTTTALFVNKNLNKKTSLD